MKASKGHRRLAAKESISERWRLPQHPGRHGRVVWRTERAQKPGKAFSGMKAIAQQPHLHALCLAASGK